MKSLGGVVIAVWWLMCSNASAQSGGLGATGAQPSFAVVDAKDERYSSQLHSEQMFGSAPDSLLDQLDAQVKRVAGRLVKLHVVAINDEMVAAFREKLLARYGQDMPLAVTFVVGKLADAKATLGIDAVVAVATSSMDKSAPRVEQDIWGRTLRPGSRVYISGQAEKAATPRQAARLTMQSLKRTLEWLDASLDDAVQVKAFLTPIDAAADVRTEIEQFISPRKIPLVLVEWQSTLPIEIELIAAVRSVAREAPVVYLTPPGMTASPVYCRVARVNASKTIYISGLTAQDATDAQQEATQVFDALQKVLGLAESDLQHLVKATYYVSSDEASTQLNAVRPKFYDPKAPPAASKAIVAGVGQLGRHLTLDMIAVPSK